MAIAARLRKAGKLGIILVSIGFGLLAAYAGTGFYLIPWLVRTQFMPGASESMGAQLTAERVETDPFELTLAIHGVSLKDKAGRELAAFRELSADIEGLESVFQRRLILSGRLVEPVLHPELDTKGKLNFEALAPAGEESGGGFPFLISGFAVERGRIEFRDASRGKPYAVVWDKVSANLENLGPEPDDKASFSLAMAGESGESLSASGAFSLEPFVSEGKLEVSDLNPAPWLDRLAPDSGWRFRSGKIGAKAEYLLRTGDKTVLEIRSGEGTGEGLELSAQGDGNTWAKIESVSLGGFFFSLAEQRLQMDSMAAQGIAAPSLKIAALSSTGWSYDPDARLLKLDSAAAQGIAAPSLKIAALSARGGSYDPETQRLKLDSAAARDALALGAPDPEQNGGGREDSGPAGAAKDELRAARIGSLRVAGVDGSLRERFMTVGSVISEQADIGLRLLPDGSLRVQGLPAMGSNGRSEEPSSAPWNLRIAEIRLDGYSIGFRDETVQPPVKLNFSPAALRLADFSTERGSLFTYRLDTRVGEKGKIEVDGQARLDPLQIDLRFGVDKLWLRSVQPYWQHLTGVDLVRGRLNLWGDITVLGGADLRVDYSGGADIVDLVTVDKKERKDFIRWKSLKFDGLVVNTQPRRVSIRTMTAEQPHARVFIAADGGLNLMRDLIAADMKSESPKAAVRPRETQPAERWPVVIGALRVVDGGMDFTDLTLKPNFAVDIQSLNGNVRGLSSQENAKAELLLEGRINHSSPVKIFGQINPSSFGDHTDVAMEFRGVNLTTLSPYSGKFAGYRIEKGKLDMDLRYKLHDRKLEAQNRVVLDHLILGERVDSPKATTLPVDLAVALLKDSAGKIDIDLPISGNLDDPEFSLRSLYASALTQMFTKLVGSPFALLGSLVESGDEDLGYVKFRPGDASLTGEEKARLSKVADALKQRPELNLDIKGAADLQQDRLALAEQALSKQLRNARLIELRTLGQRVGSSEGPELSDDDYRRLFTLFYRQRHPDSPELQALAGERQPVLKGPLLDQAKRRMLEQWAVNELDLRLLAQARSESIRNYLIREGGLPDQQIYLLDVKLDRPGDREIKAFLSLSGS
jgi:hypothetical protein